MNKQLYEFLKPDLAIAPIELAIGEFAVSGAYPLVGYRKALFALTITPNTVAADWIHGEILDIGIVDDAAIPLILASGDLVFHATAVPPHPGVLRFEHVTASERVTAMTIDTTGADDDDILTINGVAFTCALLAPVPPYVWDDGAALAAGINATLPGLTAVDAAGIVTIVSTVLGEQTITVVPTFIGTGMVVAEIVTDQAVAYLEVDASELTVGGENVYFVVDAMAITGSVAVSAVLVRDNPRYIPITQAVAAP